MPIEKQEIESGEEGGVRRPGESRHEQGVIDVPGFSTVKSTQEFVDLINNGGLPPSESGEDSGEGGAGALKSIKSDAAFRPISEILGEGAEDQGARAGAEDGGSAPDPAALSSLLEGLGIAPAEPATGTAKSPMEALLALAQAKTPEDIQALLPTFRTMAEMAYTRPAERQAAEQGGDIGRRIESAVQQAETDFDPTQLPEFQALREAEPEEYWERFKEYQLAADKGHSQATRAAVASAIAELKAQISAANEASTASQAVEHFDQKLTKEWDGSSLARPIPWSEVKSLFDQLGAQHPELIQHVAGHPTLMSRATAMYDIVARAHPQTLEKHTRRVLAPSAKHSVQKVLAAPRPSGSSSPMKQGAGGQPTGPVNAQAITRGILDWMHSE